MFDPNRRLLEEVAAAIDQNGPAKLRSADELTRWAKRQYEQRFLLLDEENRPVPLSLEQIEHTARLAAATRPSNP